MTTPADASERTPRAGYVVGRLDHVLRRELRRLLAQFDLSLPAYTTLSVLRDRPGLSSAQLARLALVTPQAMNEIVAVLLEQELITRRTDPHHQRILQARLTGKGRRLLSRCDRAVEDLEARMLEGITDADRDRLLGLLRTCVRNLGAGL
jgi:DNA-binding MarR family transcriptional regulator